MAGRRLLHVCRHERRPPAAWRTLCLDFQPELRGTPGTRRPHPSHEPRHGGRGGRRGPSHRRSTTAGLRMSEPFTTLTGVAAAIVEDNIDTDVIFPARFLLLMEKQ